jgi:hypothetical protein
VGNIFSTWVGSSDFVVEEAAAIREIAATVSVSGFRMQSRHGSSGIGGNNSAQNHNPVFVRI